jgi:hypothetical protein
VAVDPPPPSAAHHEADAFFATLDATPPHAVTACLGWTTHEIIAHLVSGAEGLANQFDAYFEGRPIPPFGSWEEREPPLRALDDATLRRRCVAADERMTAGFNELLADRGPDDVVPDVGFGFPVIELVHHMRQEYAIHRWDLIGDDALGYDLLGQADLLSHSVRMLGEPLLAIGLQRDESRGDPLTVRIRCEGRPDLVLDVGVHGGTLALDDSPGEPDLAAAADVIDTDPAARLLLLWGRRPADSRRVRSGLTAPRLHRLQTILAGF